MASSVFVAADHFSLEKQKSRTPPHVPVVCDIRKEMFLIEPWTIASLSQNVPHISGHANSAQASFHKHRVTANYASVHGRSRIIGILSGFDSAELDGSLMFNFIL